MKTIGTYRIIGRVSLSEEEEWLVGEDPLDGKEVFLRTIDIGDPKLAEKFYQEVAACGVLNHPSIFSVYRLGEQHGAAFVAVERFAGDDLRQIIKERRPFTLEQKIEIMAGIAEGLVYAHACGILHRNLRPSHVFFEAGANRTRLAGFGLARVQGATLSATGHSTQAPSYVAPEQRGGAAAEQSDIFSAAAIFYELITGAHPFQATNGSGFSRAALPPPMAAYVASIPASLEAEIMKGLTPDPKGRHPNAGELLSALRQAQVSLERDREALYGAVVAMRDEMAEKVNEIWSFLRQPWAQAMLKAGDLDLDATYSRINTELANNASLPYLHLTQLQQELNDVLQMVSRIAARIVVIDPVETLPAEQPAVVAGPFPANANDDRITLVAGTAAEPLPSPILESDEETGGSECPKCGGLKDSPDARCVHCARPRKRVALAAVSAVVIFVIGAFLYVMWRPSVSGSPAGIVSVWGTARIAKETVPIDQAGKPPSARLSAGTKVELVGQFPERAKWSLDLPVQFRLEPGATPAKASEIRSIALRELNMLSSRDQPGFVLWHTRENCPAGDLACLADVERQYAALGHADNDTASFLAERYTDETLRDAAPAPCNVTMLRKTAALLFSVVDVADLKGKAGSLKTRLEECSKRGLSTPEIALWSAFSACVGSDEPECAERVERSYALLGRDEEMVQVYLADSHMRNAAKMPAQCAKELPKAEAFLAKLAGKSAVAEKVVRIRQKLEAACSNVEKSVVSLEAAKPPEDPPNQCSTFERCRDKAGAALGKSDCVAARMWMAKAQDYSVRTEIVFDDIEEKCKP